MILNCPNCSARFMIDEHALGPEGRTVRCGACGHSWHQLPEEAAADDAASFPSDAAMAEEGAAAVARAHDAAMRDAENAPAAGYGPAAEPPRRGGSRVLVWFLFVFVLAAIVLGAHRFRNDIVRIWPPALKVYNFLGIQVQARWLRVPSETIRFHRDSEGGVPILVVSGEILNASDRAQRVAPMRLVLMDRKNLPLRTDRVKIDERVIEPGKRMPFKVSIPDPPPEAVAVRISFDLGSGS